MLVPKLIEPVNFLSPLINNKIKIQGFDAKSKIVNDFYTKYKTVDIEANSDIRSFLEQIDFINYNIADGKSLEKGKGRFDLAISLDENDRYKILIEIKKPNSPEMIELKNEEFNFFKKAFYQSVYYYLSDINNSLFENNNNSEVKFLIVTDYISWYIIKTSTLDEIFKTHGKPYIEQSNTDQAYDSIEKYFKELKMQDGLFSYDVEIPFSYFNLSDTSKENIELFLKILSPEFLLDAMDNIDRNSITKKFYNELFYILGLKQSTKKQLIKTNDNFSFLSLIYEKLDKYFSDEEEKFEKAVELIITWISRILFIHLYSSILVKYKILNEPIFSNRKRFSFEDIDDLFFEVLNKKEDRIPFRSELGFNKIPYINSSLFQITSLETLADIKISNLRSNRVVKLYENTNIPKDQQSDEMNILQYLIRFLNSYNIAVDENFTDNSDDDLINASVLGVVFEKLNGYKDGSYYTPSYITEHMANSTIEQAIIDKFNSNGFEGNTIDEIGDNISRKNHPKALRVFNSISICDPAVGSGHFLVSSLNAMLYYKSKLSLYENIKYNQIDIVDDTIIISNIESYDKTKLNTKIHEIYKELYSSKEQIIENSLFGVDINPKSVYIARLRLWIELLKHTYFVTNDELSLLPNIDINIKQGNSLISDYSLDYKFDKLFECDLFNRYKDLISQYKDPINNRIELSYEIDEIKCKINLNYDDTNKFEWRYEFPEVLDEKSDFTGFDVMIGNPPYITFTASTKKKEDDEDLLYYKDQYHKSSVYKVSSYLIFIERSLQLISEKGLLSFIVPDTINTNYFYSDFRKYLINEFSIYNMYNLDYEAFEDATVGGYSILLLGKNKINKTRLNQASNEKMFFTSNSFDINQEEFKKIPDNKFLFSNTLILLWNKCFVGSDTLGDKNFKFYQGIITGDNKKFLSDKKLNDKYRPVLRGRDFYKYTPKLFKNYILFDPKQLWSNTNEDMFKVDEKLIIRQTSDHLVATYDDSQMLSLDSTHILFDKTKKFNHKYLLALLNSKLLNFLYQIIVPNKGKAFSQVKAVNLKKLPVKHLSKKEQLKFVKIVDEILNIKKDCIEADTEELEAKIDKMVYELYNLTPNEIDIINKAYQQKKNKKKITKSFNLKQEKLSLWVITHKP